MTPLCACGQPSPHATICGACERDLVAALVTIIALAPELDVALTRQAQLGDRSHRTGYAAALPYDERASDVKTHTHAILALWVRDLAEAA